MLNQIGQQAVLAMTLETAKLMQAASTTPIQGLTSTINMGSLDTTSFSRFTL